MLIDHTFPMPCIQSGVCKLTPDWLEGMEGTGRDAWVITNATMQAFCPTRAAPGLWAALEGRKAAPAHSCTNLYSCIGH